MSNYSISNRRKRTYISSHQFLDRWNWDLLATLTFAPGDIRMSSHYARKKMEYWVRKHAAEKNMHIGAVYILCYRCGHPHIHALLVGRGRSANDPATLRDTSISSFNRHWYNLTKIEIPENQKAVTKYLASHHFSYKCDRATLDIVNEEFLGRLENRRQPQQITISSEVMGA